MDNPIWPANASVAHLLHEAMQATTVGDFNSALKDGLVASAFAAFTIILFIRYLNLILWCLTRSVLTLLFLIVKTLSDDDNEAFDEATGKKAS